MEYTLSFIDNKDIAKFDSFEFAVIAAKSFSKIIANEVIVLRSTFFTYTFFNGLEQ